MFWFVRIDGAFLINHSLCTTFVSRSFRTNVRRRDNSFRRTRFRREPNGVRRSRVDTTGQIALLAERFSAIQRYSDRGTGARRLCNTVFRRPAGRKKLSIALMSIGTRDRISWDGKSSCASAPAFKGRLRRGLCARAKPVGASPRGRF